MPIEPPQSETPPHISSEPKKPEGVVLTDKQKTAQLIVRNILGMVQTKWAIVQFKNSPLVWVQYFSALAMKMPVIVIMKRSDTEWMPSLKHPLVKAFFQVNDFTGPEAEHMADKIAHFIKKHPEA